MKITVDIPDYDPYQGIKISWEPGFKILVNEDSDGAFVISANREGLISLARDLLTLANPAIPVGSHIHLDSYGGLEDGSKELILNKQE